MSNCPTCLVPKTGNESWNGVRISCEAGNPANHRRLFQLTTFGNERQVYWAMTKSILPTIRGVFFNQLGKNVTVTDSTAPVCSSLSTTSCSVNPINSYLSTISSPLLATARPTTLALTSAV